MGACRNSNVQYRPPSAQAAPHLFLFFRPFHRAIFVRSPDIQAANYENLGIVRLAKCLGTGKVPSFLPGQQVPFRTLVKWGEMANPQVIVGCAPGWRLWSCYRTLRYCGTNRPTRIRICLQHSAGMRLIRDDHAGLQSRDAFQPTLSHAPRQSIIDHKLTT